jgi:preprotein translocase SecE subunit
MAVAVKNTTEAAPRQAPDPVAMGSLLGALYVLGSLAVVFYAVPRLWALLVSPWLAGTLGLAFIDTALLLVAMLAAGAGLFLFGQRLAGPSPAPGLRAGTLFAVLGLLAVGLLTPALGFLLERGLGVEARVLGIAVTAAIGVALLALLARAFFHPAVKRWALELEGQGWFTTAPYKRSQGQRVRRGTILAILVLAGCGIYTLIAHKTLDFGVPYSNNWGVWVPFTAGQYITLLPDVRFTLPILLTLLTLWLAYRIVNYPTFADFLIATEAEMNKVSWTTRKRLVQDTIVVLVTVLLFTVFIFIVDVIWGWGLSKVGVLQLPTGQTEERKQVDW